ncbi:gH [anatid alphaherpesvirus 1]|uniref:GH n=1 Tax=anatid alphaherpesvirus 1 TaxID=104388 RepID=A4GRJ3_9ALPH|nr:UL22 [Anatid alphaherpesvirus 1]YP_010795354.1 gH [Anatid alphaherpesvirus 1]AHD45960.1 UL22 [BAC cloning vector pDEV-vac]QWQ49774.1 UL22 [BAC cloning vector pDEV-CHa]ABO26209.1 UL22-like [Anatid alphaherpesvirus 1]ABY73911.1 glycoprotein H [Anatid alphaherpesvirus 1]ACT83552.1 UL22 [Anatid alphaherpesvirus 1]
MSQLTVLIYTVIVFEVVSAAWIGVGEEDMSLNFTHHVISPDVLRHAFTGIVTDSGPTGRSTSTIHVSSVLGAPYGINSTDLSNLKWIHATTIFFFVTNPKGTKFTGTLLFVPREAGIKFRSIDYPDSVMLASPNFARSLACSATPDNLSEYGKIKLKEHVDDIKHVRPVRPKPSGSNPPKDIAKISFSDILRPSEAFFDPKTLLPSALEITRFVDPLASVWPVDYYKTAELRFGTDRAEAVANIGDTFMTLTLSMASSRPIEILIAHTRSPMFMIWPRFDTVFEPPHLSISDKFKTYILASFKNSADNEFRDMTELGAITAEVLEPQNHISEGHLQLLLMLSNAQEEDDVYFWRRIVTRVALIAFSFITESSSSKFTSLEDYIATDLNTRFLATAVCKTALTGDPDTFFMRTGLTLSEKATSILTTRVIELVDDIHRKSDYGKREPLEEVLNVLRLGYGLAGDKRLDSALDKLSTSLISNLYSDIVMLHMGWNVTAKHTLFFATESTLGSSVPSMVRARFVLLLLTSMCTDIHAASINVNLQEIFISVTDRGNDFSMLDLFSPCVTALRYDTHEGIHKLYVLSSIPDRLRLVAALKSDKDGGIHKEDNLNMRAERTIERWRNQDITAIKHFLPELFDCGERLNLSPDNGLVMLLPLTPNGTFIISRHFLDVGVTYRILGVDVNNPLYITFKHAGCSSSSSNIASVQLPRPGTNTECLYCGCVIMRYTSTGAVLYSVYIADLAMQREFMAGINSSTPFFNPASFGGAESLLLFPNGTIVNILAFEQKIEYVIPGTYIAIAVGGMAVAVLVFYGIIKLMCNLIRNGDLKELLSNEE